MLRAVRAWATTISLLLLVAAGGCELQRDPTGLTLERAVPGVYSVLVEGEEEVRVLVVRFSRDVPIASAGISPVGDADVHLVRNGEETSMNPDDTGDCVSEQSLQLVQPGEGCYTAMLSAPVAPGDRFELTVRLADGEVVRGAAVIPGTPVVGSPAPGDTVRVTSSGGFPSEGHLPVEVLPPPDGALLEVAVRTSREPFCRVGLSLPVEQGSLSSGRAVRITADDAGQLAVTVDALCRSEEGDVEPVGELPVQLLALAYDTAYARWTGELAVDGQDLPLDGASAGLRGAVGYFAGAGRVTLPLMVVED